MTLRLAWWAAVAALLSLTSHSQASNGTGSIDAAAYFTTQQHEALRAGRPVVRILKSHGNEVAMAAAVRTVASRDRMIAWGRRIEALHAGAFTPMSGRFSSPPRIEDLSGLTLSAEDLNDLRVCRPGACGVKLAAPEIRSIREAVDAAPADWRMAALSAYRRVLLARATAFEAEGYAAVLPYHDHKKPTSPALDFGGVLAGREQYVLMPFDVAEYFGAYPRGDARRMESFLSWSKNVASGVKEVVSISLVTIRRCEGDENRVAVISSQVYASHYLNASLSYTVLLGNGDDHYLLYLRRTRVDVIRGPFGGLIRNALEGRVLSDAPALLDSLRLRLESGNPPATHPQGVESTFVRPS